MIRLLNKQDCCGCSACMQKCPKHCITMSEDSEGFLYPQIDFSLCIDCGLCEKVCPVLNQGESHKPLRVYAAKNSDEYIRMNSSSGGVFTMLAEQVIQKKGVVFGAKFNEQWEVVHSYTETMGGLEEFRGSKYVQSQIGESYKQVESFLKQGRKVLFSGTPCQIAGLKKYLLKEYENLLTVDFICHGVPSLGIWRQYLKEEILHLCNKKSLTSTLENVRNVRIINVSFRNKKYGWKKFSFSLDLAVTDDHGNDKTISLLEPLDTNLFLRGFLADLYLRPSCHACPAKELKSGSDITLGDWWGIRQILPEYDDNRGVSVITANTERGYIFLHQIKELELKHCEYNDLITYNSALIKSSKLLPKRISFYNRKEINLLKIIDELSKPTLERRIKNYIKNIISHILF